MKNYKSIRRLFEDETQQPAMPAAAPAAPAAAPAMPLLPDAGELSTPSDPMVMTVRDFLAKCKQVDPIVCMGIESFIEKNAHQFGEPTPAMPAGQDISFSSQVPPAPAPVASFDQQSQDALNFPTA